MNETQKRTLRIRQIWMGICLVITVVIGVASRKLHTPIPWRVQKELGDVLWSTAAYFAIGLIRPRWRPLNVAILATGLAMLSELSQLSHAGWLEALRGYPIGHLLLGSGFSWIDMSMYPVGALAAWLIDR